MGDEHDVGGAEGFRDWIDNFVDWRQIWEDDNFRLYTHSLLDSFNKRMPLKGWKAAMCRDKRDNHLAYILIDDKGTVREEAPSFEGIAYLMDAYRLKRDFEENEHE